MISYAVGYILVQFVAIALSMNAQNFMALPASEIGPPLSLYRSKTIQYEPSNDLAVESGSENKTMHDAQWRRGSS